MAAQQGLNPFSELRKESLDIFNRLHSIEEDIGFVNLINEAYPNLSLLPNLRCGEWYADPARATHVPAYFKSTDGHFGNWGFNLRRSNLHLLSVIIQSSGIVLVDSTRSGKRIPDALSKTVPIWCTVINRALLKRYPDLNHENWDLSLYTPPTSVSSQEHDQISERLDGWADSLVRSSFELPKLPCPLRPFWITPATSSFPKFETDPESRTYLPMICVSASKQVHDGTERRTSGFSYIQGSGDDHELWGMGLTPQIFWNNKESLLSTNRIELPRLVSSLVSSQTNTSSSTSQPRKAPEGISKISNRISIATLSDLDPILLLSPAPLTAFVLIDELSSEELHTSFQSSEAFQPPPVSSPPDTAPTASPSILKFKIPGGKKSQTVFLYQVLPTALSFISDKLEQGFNVIIACPSAKDLSVGVALAATSRCFDNHGIYVRDNTPNLTKQSIRTRLEWIIASCPRANPSRATLKRVNEFLLTAGHFRR